MRVCVVNKTISELIDSKIIHANKTLIGSPYEKGLKFYYEIDKIETLNGSHRQKTYYIYRMETQEYLFGPLDEKEFHKYFVDLEDYREDTINDLLK